MFGFPFNGDFFSNWPNFIDYPPARNVKNASLPVIIVPALTFIKLHLLIVYLIETFKFKNFEIKTGGPQTRLGAARPCKMTKTSS